MLDEQGDGVKPWAA